MEQEYQDAGSEYEQRDGEDLMELSKIQDRVKERMEFIENCYNSFMVTYFKQGYSFVEASKKAMQDVDQILDDVEESRNETI